MLKFKIYDCGKNNKIKCCCIFCCKEMFNIYMKNHIKICKKKDWKINEDKVICQICFGRFKEINNFHLKTHDITCNEYDKKFKGSKRISNKSLIKKDTLSNIMNDELSKKLKKSHTLIGYIEKYGEEKGRLKYEQRTKNYSKSRTLIGYIEKYGEEKGRLKYEEKTLKISKSLKKLWDNNHELLKKSRTLIGYIEKYGEEKGRLKWFDKNNKISKANSKINDKNITEWNEYKNKVDRITNLTIKNFKIKDINKRGKKLKYDLDHKISKCFGFINNISPYLIGSKYNICVIPSFDNNSKNLKNSLNIEDIYEQFITDDFYLNLIGNDVLNEN